MINEQLISLTAEDRAELEKDKIIDGRGCVWLLCIVFAVVLIGLTVFFIQFLRIAGERNNSVDIRAWYVLGGFIAVSALALYLMPRVYRKLGKVREKPNVVKDLTGGVKKVISEPITEIMIDSREIKPRNSHRIGLSGTLAAMSSDGGIDMKYLIVAGDKTYEVSSDEYYRLKVGDLIETHIAPSSGRIFFRRIAKSGEVIKELEWKNG